MAITKTGITVSTTGENDKTFEVDGQQNTVRASGLTPNKQYTVAAYVVDSGYGKIDAAQTTTFTTLPEGQLTLSNVSAVWGTQTAQLTFSCDWASTYNVPGASNNFKLFVSQTADFADADEITPNWSRQLDGLSGRINDTVLTAKINTRTPNSDYYVKVQLTDIYGEVRSETFHYYTPTSQAAGTFSYSAIASDSSNKNAIWFPTTTIPSTFSYNPSKKRIIATKDNWATISNTSGWKNWPNNGYELFIFFDPNNYACRMEIQDIYGNVFRSASDTQVICPQPTLFASSENRKGQIYTSIHLNPNLNYTSTRMVYDGNNGGTVNLLPAQETYWLYTDVDDGTYDVYVEAVATNPSYSYTTQSISVTVTNVGYIEVTDHSTFQNNQMRFECDFQMGKWDVVPETLDVVVYDENFDELANFQPSIISGDKSGGTLGYNDAIELPEGCEYIYYMVKCENDGGYNNEDEVDIELAQQGS